MMQSSLATLERLARDAETVVADILRAGTEAARPAADGVLGGVESLWNHNAPRSPDYFVLNASGGLYFPVADIPIGVGPVWGLNIAYSRTGNLYVGPELGFGAAAGKAGLSVAPSLRAGWVGDPRVGEDPTPGQLDDFLSESIAVSGSGAPIGPVSPSLAGVYGTPWRIGPKSFGVEAGVTQSGEPAVALTGTVAAKPGQKIWWSPLQFLPPFTGPHW